MSGSVLPASFGRYRTTALLGRGAMGTVYRARDPLIGRDVAIKVVDTERLDAAMRQEYLARFHAEAQAAGRCNHPAIVAIYDVSAEGEQPFIVMELVEGASLQHVLRNTDLRSRTNILSAVGPLSAVYEVLEGLGFAHGQGVIHRDIKPANILLTREGRAKIADFGIARLDEGMATGTGAMLGTPSYMAPEQIIGAAVDHRADLFAVGVILYEILTGRPPFAGRNLSETVLRLTNPEPVDLAPVMASHPGFAQVLARALAKRVPDRFASAAAFAQALHAALDTPSGMAETVVLHTGGRSFEPALLSEIETSLARFVGPMAHVLVLRAAEDATSREALVELLAKHLPRPADVQQFLREQRVRIEPRSGATRAGATSGGTTTGLGQTASRAVPVSPELLAAAETALTFHIGPIAHVLVGQASASAANAVELTEQLAQHLRRPEDAAQFRRRMMAAITGRKSQPG